MDGVIYHGNKLLPGVSEFLKWLKDNDKSYLFLTNSGQYTPRELQQKLHRLGLEVDESHFYTSALATAQFLNSQAPGCSAYVIGEHGILNALYDVGITYNDVNPDYVVVGEASSYNLEMITRAVRLVNKGAKLIGTNYDLTGPTEEGIAPACRALLSPIELATGNSAYYVGKPNPLMMRTGLKLLGVHSENAAIIGLSALMTTTMMRMQDVVELCKEKGCKSKVIIGGACITQSFADEIGADGYSKDAAECVRLVERLLA